jgi:hypothetical protein
MDESIFNNIVETLIRISEEAKKQDISAADFGRRGVAIKYLLDKVEEDFGLQSMIKVFTRASKELGRPLGPLDVATVQKLVSLGFKIQNMGRVVEYKKNLESTN